MDKTYETKNLVKTRAWLNFIKQAGNHENANQIAVYFVAELQRQGHSATGDKSINFRKYIKNLSHPSPATLEESEVVYPGSLEVFSSGPDNSGLFEAMFNENYKPEGWGYFGWIESLHLCFNDDILSGYKSTIQCLKTRLNEGNLFLPEESISPINELNLLASMLYILRLLTDSRRSKFSELEKILSFIFELYENSKLLKKLAVLSLHDSILEWVLIRIESYCLSRAYQSLTLNRELPANASNLKDDLNKIIDFVKNEVLYETAAIDSAHNLRIHLGYIQSPVDRSCTT